MARPHRTVRRAIAVNSPAAAASSVTRVIATTNSRIALKVAVWVCSSVPIVSDA